MINTFPNIISTFDNGNRGVLSAAATGLSEFIEKKGADVDRVFGISGIQPELLLSPTLSLQLPHYCEVLEQAARISQCDNFGLYFGNQFQPKSLGLIGYIALCSSTLENALQNLTSHFHLHQKDTLCQMIVKDQLIQINYQVQHGAILSRRQDAELTIGMFMNIIREVLGSRYSPRAIHFEHPKPEFWQEHSKLFNAPVYFDHPCNSILLHKADLQIKMSQSDPLLLTMMIELLTRLNSDHYQQSLIDQVRAHIQLDLVNGEPNLEKVANDLKLTSCGLSRKLKNDHITFTQLIDQVRHELARNYINQKNLPISEVAFLLGYSEVSAFSRAFKRWFGCTPRQVRH